MKQHCNDHRTFYSDWIEDLWDIVLERADLEKKEKDLIQFYASRFLLELSQIKYDPWAQLYKSRKRPGVEQRKYSERKKIHLLRNEIYVIRVSHNWPVNPAEQAQ